MGAVVKAIAAPVKAAVNIVASPVNAVVDIAQGKNVVDSVSSAVKNTAVNVVAGGTSSVMIGSTALDAATGGKISSVTKDVPILGSFTRIGNTANDVAWSNKATRAQALSFGRDAATIGATALTAGVAAPALGFSPVVGVGGVAALSQGDWKGGVSAVGGGLVGDLLPEGSADIARQVKNGLSTGNGVPGRSPSSSSGIVPGDGGFFDGGQGSGGNVAALIAVAGVVGAVWFIKGRK